MEPEAVLQKRMTEELKQAMKSGDTVKRDTLRMLISSVKNAEIAKLAALTDADVLGVISREVKRHQESIDAFKKGNRADLVSKEEAEMAILQSYLPKQMSPDEIRTAAKEVIAAVGATGPGDKGKVMQQLMPRLKGKADGKEINDAVTELLGK
ncbi:MAG: aspartyl-tRNA amidotransferase [Chloroflexi bacterium RBG_16_50_11]|nr:MAG: aspartyl-tRNA amidotransferase [Chloroflexi bacterium RBG_16_50_11]